MSKVCVVVGAGPGTGFAIANKFAREGFSVALLARNKEKLATLQKAIEDKGGKAISVSVDVGDPKAVANAFHEVRTILGDPEVLVFNASGFTVKKFLELTPEDFDASYKVSILGAFASAKEVLPKMVEKKKGTILLSGATASLRGSSQFAAMAVGKFGLRAIGQSLAREFGPQGVHVAHIILDGLIDTPNTRSRFDIDKLSHLETDAIAESYWNLHSQAPSAWTQELDLRAFNEKF